MQYNRKLINLVFDIKRTLPDEQKDEFKVSAPDLLDRVVDIYHNTRDAATRDLSKRFLELAGHEVPENKPRTYRGMVMAEEQKPRKSESESGETSRPVKMYRGRIVDE